MVVLRYFLDLSEEATAAELGIAVGTVKSTNARALAKLRVSPDLAGATVPEDPPQPRRRRIIDVDRGASPRLHHETAGLRADIPTARVRRRAQGMRRRRRGITVATTSR